MPANTGAFTLLEKDWKCITVVPEIVTTEKDDASAAAQNLFRRLTDFQYIRLLHFLLDYLETVQNFSLKFQRDEFFFLIIVKLYVESTMTSLESLKCSP